MTGRTHDLAAFTALGYIVTTYQVPYVSLSTAIGAVSANLIGGLFPDLDQPTAKLWRDLPAGTIFGKLLSPLFGGHRFLSHSLLGLGIFGFGVNYLLQLMSSTILIDMHIVWIAFMIGYLSHLIMDSFTKEGVPWLFPLPIRFGFPPFKFLRIKTGGLIEQVIVFPGLLLFNIYLYYTHYAKVLDYLHHFLK